LELFEITFFDKMKNTTTLQKPQKITLRLKRPIKAKKCNVRLFSWKGLEQYKEKVHQLAHEILECEKALEQVAALHGWSVTGLWCSAIRDPSSVTYCKEAVNAGLKSRELRDLQYDLVWKHNLDFDFVRKEYAPIFDPNQAERCELLIKNNQVEAEAEEIEEKLHI